MDITQFNTEINATTKTGGPPTRRAVAALTEQIGNLFASPSYQPPVLPTVAVDLLDATRYPDIDLKRIARMIETDPMLAGLVMRRVRSPMYSGRVVIKDLNHAICRLGLNNIRDIVLESALNMKLFTTPGYVTTMEHVRRHSVATAHIARILARHTGQNEHRLFLFGLLHDVGLAAAIITIDELFEGSARPPIQHVWPTIETIHESAGILLARLWNLPGDLPQLIGQHHHFRTTGQPNDAIATLHVAEMIAQTMGRGILGTATPKLTTTGVDSTPDEVVAQAQTQLGLTRADIKFVYTTAAEQLDAIR